MSAYHPSARRLLSRIPWGNTHARGCALGLANGDLLLAGTSRDAVTDDPDILAVRTDAQGAHQGFNLKLAPSWPREPPQMACVTCPSARFLPSRS